MKQIPILYYTLTDPNGLTNVNSEDRQKAYHFAFDEQIRLEVLQHGRLNYYHQPSASLQRTKDKLLHTTIQDVEFYEASGHKLSQYMADCFGAGVCVGRRPCV